MSTYVRRPRVDGAALGIGLAVVAGSAALAHSGKVSAPGRGRGRQGAVDGVFGQGHVNPG